MAEHGPSGPVEVGAEMDYAEHEKTYNGFLALAKYGTIVCVALMIAMAFSFYTPAGWFSGIILFLLIVAIGAFAAA